MQPAGSSKSNRSVRMYATRHCEERSDEAIQFLLAATGLLRFARNDCYAASAAMRALMILSGFFTGSPRLILSTFSMPEVTLPHTVYWLLRKEASSKQMKNWLSPESG